VTFAFNPDGKWIYQHFMSVSNMFKDISADHLLRWCRDSLSERDLRF
jgi:hypothetical protein